MTMKFYLMARKVEENSTLLDQVSHELVEFTTGRMLPKSFQGPLIVELDEEFIDGEMATFYMQPAVIGTHQFYQEFKLLGVKNIETHPVVIQDKVNNREIHDYVLMNILGRISCANMNESKYSDLGDGMKIIDKLVIDHSKVHGHDLFLAHEDTDCIVISERIQIALSEKNYSDIYFEELEQV